MQPLKEVAASIKRRGEQLEMMMQEWEQPLVVDAYATGKSVSQSFSHFSSLSNTIFALSFVCFVCTLVGLLRPYTLDTVCWDQMSTIMHSKDTPSFTRYSRYSPSCISAYLTRSLATSFIHYIYLPIYMCIIYV
jgi:hypothetical protein